VVHVNSATALFNELVLGCFELHRCFKPDDREKRKIVIVFPCVFGETNCGEEKRARMPVRLSFHSPLSSVPLGASATHERAF
jgi:hypothetical protein